MKLIGWSSKGGTIKISGYNLSAIPDCLLVFVCFSIGYFMPVESLSCALHSKYCPTCMKYILTTYFLGTGILMVRVHGRMWSFLNLRLKLWIVRKEIVFLKRIFYGIGMVPI